MLTIKTRVTCPKPKCGADAMLVPESVKVGYLGGADLPYHGIAVYECVRGHRTTYTMTAEEDWPE